MQERFKYLLIFLTVLSALTACKKEEINPQDDPRMKYVGAWNFKGTHHYFSGYYIYNPEPTWTYISTYTYYYDDSTGSISLGQQPYELIFKYCSTCDPVVYDLRENGADKWTLSETDFFNNVAPEPPGYNPTYTTYKIEGWKL